MDDTALYSFNPSNATSTNGDPSDHQHSNTTISSFTMDSALSIPELLETIFLHLDLQTLLACVPRVSKAWHDVVSTSPALQQALHFLPVTNHPEGAPPQPNPLLVKCFSPLFFEDGPTLAFPRHAESFFTLPWTTTPYTIGFAAPRTVNYAAIYQLMKPNSSPGPSNEAVERLCFTRRGASWRRMLVSQPPPPFIGLVLADGTNYPEGAQAALKAEVPASDPGGVRMGQLYDLLQCYVGHDDFPCLWFRVLWTQPDFGFHTDLCKNISRELFTSTHIVVDMYHGGNQVSFSGEPPRAEGFNDTFRCDEFTEPDVDVRVVTAESFQLPGWGADLILGTGTHVLPPRYTPDRFS